MLMLLARLAQRNIKKNHRSYQQFCRSLIDKMERIEIKPSMIQEEEKTSNELPEEIKPIQEEAKNSSESLESEATELDDSTDVEESESEAEVVDLRKPRSRSNSVSLKKSMSGLKIEPPIFESPQKEKPVTTKPKNRFVNACVEVKPYQPDGMTKFYFTFDLSESKNKGIFLLKKLEEQSGKKKISGMEWYFEVNGKAVTLDARDPLSLNDEWMTGEFLNLQLRMKSSLVVGSQLCSSYTLTNPEFSGGNFSTHFWEYFDQRTKNIRNSQSTRQYWSVLSEPQKGEELDFFKRYIRIRNDIIGELYSIGQKKKKIDDKKEEALDFLKKPETKSILEKLSAAELSMLLKEIMRLASDRRLLKENKKMEVDEHGPLRYLRACLKKGKTIETEIVKEYTEEKRRNTRYHDMLSIMKKIIKKKNGGKKFRL